MTAVSITEDTDGRPGLGLGHLSVIFVSVAQLREVYTQIGAYLQSLDHDTGPRCDHCGEPAVQVTVSGYLAWIHEDGRWTCPGPNMVGLLCTVDGESRVPG